MLRRRGVNLLRRRGVNFSVFSTKTDEIEFITNQIKELKAGGLNYSDIAIGFRTKEALKEIKTNLHKIKIPYNDNTSSATNDSGGVVLSTFHGLKGLEFKAVFLADVNNRTCPFYFSGFNELENAEKIEFENSEKSLIYVAMTRAISHLFISGIGVKTELIRL